jgi:hypothetical protein
MCVVLSQPGGRRACVLGRNGKVFTFLMRDPMSAWRGRQAERACRAEPARRGVGVGVAWQGEAGRQAGKQASRQAACVPCRARRVGSGVCACVPGRNGKGFTFLMRDPISAEALQLLANKC